MYNIEIFKAYDIRGIYPDDFDEDFAYRLGRAYPDYIREASKELDRTLEVVVNRDARSSSDILSKALIEGLIDAGCYVIDAGLASSPMHYFIINHTNADGGLMVTASHNPAKYNGFKMSRRGAIPIGSSSGMEEIQSLIFKKNYKEMPDTKGASTKKDYLKDYADYLTKGIQLKDKKIKIVVDAGNGMAGMVVKEVFSRFPNIDLVPLYFVPDCTFPNHEANPAKEENMKELKKQVIINNADLGIAFDGDGDRVFFLDHEAKIVRAEHVAAIYFVDYLKKYQGSKIVVETRDSKILSDAAREHGGEVIMSRVGHAYIKRILKDGGASFGAELVGHFYFKEFFGVDSGVFMVMQILKILVESGKNLKELVAPYEGKYFHSGEINFETQKKAEKISAIEAKYANFKIGRIDGITVDGEDWWFNIRSSNTEPLLRLNVEATSKDVLRQKVRELVDFINQ